MDWGTILPAMERFIHFDLDVSSLTQSIADVQQRENRLHEKLDGANNMREFISSFLNRKQKEMEKFESLLTNAENSEEKYSWLLKSRDVVEAEILSLRAIDIYDDIAGSVAEQLQRLAGESEALLNTHNTKQAKLAKLQARLSELLNMEDAAEGAVHIRFSAIHRGKKFVAKDYETDYTDLDNARDSKDSDDSTVSPGRDDFNGSGAAGGPGGTGGTGVFAPVFTHNRDPNGGPAHPGQALPEDDDDTPIEDPLNQASANITMDCMPDEDSSVSVPGEQGTASATGVKSNFDADFH
ncbi:hypothetical protein [Acidovorax sp. CCYZU-2555]|uniref:hypothetical protein n=1 Tax=Acidovorax sp. CCYZU-2555 TaxID=2835042 RepID=UPI001BCF43AD|nr:hypothetical protein [Acidovorax sp. CCYZU-2555]MBS7780129.1 hypothetical protein [Acidovorax sp. CCYZU-2555]